MFYSQSRNRHKHWYHLLSVGHKKLWALAIVCAFVLVACLIFLVMYSIRAVSYDIQLVGSGLPGSVLYDSQHHVVSSLTEREDAPVSWEELPEHLIQAFLAREDAHFFKHRGVVYSALARSVLRNVLAMRYKQGASTITMQLTRHVFELQGKTLDRKLLEIMLAQRVENNYDKRTILCQYLSRIYFGQNCYGIREAARFYFNKSVKDLSLEESALLAGIVCAPSLYNPKRNLELARKARNETLQRMLSLEMISPEQCEQAEAAPISLNTPSASGNKESKNSYPAMWANAELDALPIDQEERGQGLSVVGYLHLPLQQYMEDAVKRALAAVEDSTAFPEVWRDAPSPTAAASPEQIRCFSSARRPAWLRPAGAALKPGQATLQCCALIIDSRLNRRGEVLAVVAGRDASDGENRWLSTVQPGRAAASLVFCGACLPGGNAHHIVAHSARVTGARLGYGVVRSFFDSLALETPLPDKAHENDLYDGLFPMRKIDLARLLFDLQNMGQGYKLNIISSVWSHGRRLLYAAENEKAPEYIRRESAVAVSHLPPFQYREGAPTVLHEELPANGGQWSMVFNDRGVAVFVWMGIESPGDTPPATPDLRKLISHASILLARELHAEARRQLRAASSTP